MNENIEDGQKKIVQYIISGGQVNIISGNGIINSYQNNENKAAEKQIIIVNKQHYNYDHNYNEQKPNNSADESWLGIIAILFATIFYVKYHWQIRLGYVVISALIEILTVTIYYSGKNNKILYDKNLQEIAKFNMISIVIVPALIGIISSPIYSSKINIDILKQQIESEGNILEILNSSLVIYAMFQMAGMFFIGLFFLYIFLSDLYIISVLNVVMERRGQWFWKWLLRKTCGKSKEGGRHIMIGAILMVISIVMTSGVLAYILDLLWQRG